MVSEVSQANEKYESAFAAIDYNKAPRSYRDARCWEDRTEWGGAYPSEQQGFIERGVFEVVLPPAGVNLKIFGTATVYDYKKISGVFQAEEKGMHIRTRGSASSRSRRFSIGPVFTYGKGPTKGIGREAPHWHNR
jgi:hypothetical protein